MSRCAGPLTKPAAWRRRALQMPLPRGTMCTASLERKSMPRGMILAWRAGCGAAVAALVLALMSSGPSAQPRMKKNPTLIYVPSPQSIVDKMLEVAKVTADDFVIDLGSGDGRIPITA